MANTLGELSNKENSRPGISSFTLKIIAIIGMTADHAGFMLRDYLPFEATCALIALGGVTFPIMAYLINEGYTYTSNFKRYAMRLFLFAVVAQVPYSLFLMQQGNILFTLVLGLGVIRAYDVMKNRTAFWGLLTCAVLGSVFLDWGLIGIPMILAFHALPTRRKQLGIALLFPVVIFLLPALSSIALLNSLAALPDALFVLVGCSLSVPLIFHYNGKRGKPMKYFFYIYYPTHIALLGIIKGYLFGFHFL